MVKGVKALMFSAGYFPDDDVAEPGKFDRWLEGKLGNEKMQKVITALAVFLSLGLTILLFFLLPTFLAGFIDPYIKSAAVHNLVESVIKLVIFFAYMLLCSKQKDIYRVFQYHGAEHKTIFCYEAGLPDVYKRQGDGYRICKCRRTEFFRLEAADGEPRHGVEHHGHDGILRERSHQRDLP